VAEAEREAFEDEEETVGQELEPKQRKRLPASLGMSGLLPPGSAGKTVTATVRYADCVAEKVTPSQYPTPRRRA
jgi:hypothetical protein